MSDTIVKLVRANMKRIRKQKGMTQRQVASAMNSPVSHYNRIELGHITPSIPSLTKIAHALQIQVVQLFEEWDTSKISLADKIKRIEALPESERKMIEQVVQMALEKHQSS